MILMFILSLLFLYRLVSETVPTYSEPASVGDPVNVDKLRLTHVLGMCR